jgi:dTMP kinase
MHPYTELCLLAASRSQHVQNVLKPAIAAKKWVLCDRFTDSSLAYQGYGRGLSLDMILSINNLVCDGVVPDAVILCDIDPEIAMDRIKKRRKDRIEKESYVFFERVRQGYLDIAAQSDRHLVIDSSVSPQKMLSTVLDYLGIVRHP